MDKYIVCIVSKKKVQYDGWWCFFDTKSYYARIIGLIFDNGLYFLICFTCNQFLYLFLVYTRIENPIYKIRLLKKTLLVLLLLLIFVDMSCLKFDGGVLIFNSLFSSMIWLLYW